MPVKPLEDHWGDALRAAGVQPAQAVLLDTSPVDWGRRVYRAGSRIYKVVLATHSTTAKARHLTLGEEAQLLGRLRGVPGVPRLITYVSAGDAEALVMDSIEAVAWNEYRHGWTKLLVTFPRLVAVLIRLSWMSITHGDVKPENVLVDGAGYPWLVDFDQAHVSTRINSLMANLLGISTGGERVHFGATQFVRELVKARLPRPLMGILRSLKRLLRANPKQAVPQLGPVPPHASQALAVMHQAWQVAALSDANAPGQRVCYYNMHFEGFLLPGERPWEERWRSLSSAVRWQGARVLELGCNVGLLSTFALLSGAEAALGVDADEMILKANRLVQEAHGVHYQTVQWNFDAPTPWEESLAAFRPTVVSALSVLNWIADKDRFLRFLGRFETVLFEGHDPDAVEARRLEAVGFKRIELISRSERQRGVLIATKKGPQADGQAQGNRSRCGTGRTGHSDLS